MKKSFISLLRKTLLLPPLVIIFLMVTGWAVQEYFSWQKEAIEEKENLLMERKNFLSERAAISSSFIEYQRKATLQRVKSDLASRIEDTYRLINSINEYSAGIKEGALDSIILRTLEDQGFAGYGGFVMDYSARLLEYPGMLMPLMPCNSETIPSKYLLDRFKEGKKKNGQVSFITKSGDGKYGRIYCLKKIESLGWIIGMSASLQSIETEAQEVIRGWFSVFESVGPLGFIFIADSEGMIITAPDKEKLDVTEASQGTLYEKTLKEISQNKGGYSEITWISRKDGLSRKSLVTGFFVPGWEWTVGIGFFTDDLEKASGLKKEQGRQEMILGLRFLLMMLPLFVACGFFIYRRIARKLERNILEFHDFFTNAQETGLRISTRSMDFREFESMADAANSMLDARQASEGRLRRSEANFSSFFNSLEDSIFVVDEDLNTISMNPSAYKLTGLNPENATPYDISQIFDLETVSKIREYINSQDERSGAIGQGHVSTAEELKRNIETFVFKGMWNESKAFFLLSRDISDVVASETKFSTVFNESPVMMSISTIGEGRIIDINKSATELLGYPKDYFIGKTSSDLNIFADRRWRDRIRPILDRDGLIRNEEVDLLAINGNILHCIFSMDYIFLSGSRYVLTVANNITDRKKAERAMLSAKEEAIESKAKLEETLKDLELFNKLMTDREERIISLKEEINALLREAGKEVRYNIDVMGLS